MKIYTKTGDLGETGLFGGRRVAKHHLRIEAYGTVDETNAVLGRAVVDMPEGERRQAVTRIQSELFTVGADLATPLDASTSYVVRVDEAAITYLEMEIDGWQAQLPALRSFILPGGTGAGATLHLARTICRRAERAVNALAEEEPVNETAQRYLNRLSDWLFVLARLENYEAGVPEQLWKPEKTPSKPEAGR